MRYSTTVFAGALAFFSAMSHADPITPIVNGIIAPTGLALPALPIPDGVPAGIPGLPGLGGSGAPGIPTEIPGVGGLPELPGLGGSGAPGIPTEIPGLGGVPEIPGLGGSSGGGSPLSPLSDLVGALLPSSTDTDPITGQLNSVLTPRTGVELPPLFAPLFNQFPYPGLPSLTGTLIGLLGSNTFSGVYGQLNYRRGELVYVVIVPLQLILAMSTDPVLYQAALLRSSAHLQNALLGPPSPDGGIGFPGF